jgi:MGT family glycosyltransferase
MTKIIAHTTIEPGHAYPFLPILRELQRRGIAVKLCVSSLTHELPPEMGGVPLRPIRGAGLERVSPAVRGREAERIFLANLARSGQPTADAMELLIREEQPDLLLVDPTLWGSMTVAESSLLPWASVAHNPLSIRGRGLDIRGPGLRPMRGPWGRLRDMVVDLQLRTSLLYPLVMLNDLRERYGLEPLGDFRDRYIAAPLVIATTAEPFEYPRADWPESIVFVGPMTWEPEATALRWSRQCDGQPLLLIAGSTVSEYKTDGSWIRIACEAFDAQPFQVIATLPTDDAPAMVPSNFHVCQFVPHRELLAHAACVICHGGYGTTSKALAAGVPVVAIPAALDRFEVARRVEVAGAGVMLREDELTADRLRAAVQTAIARKTGAERIAEAFRQAGGPNAAVDAILALCSKEKALPYDTGEE